MAKVSAGLLMYRRRRSGLEMLLVHPGGPFWKNKDLGAWSIPQGEVEAGEDELSAAKREFAEEIGVEAEGTFVELGPVMQKGGKVVHAWAVEGEVDPESVRSNTFELEWPPQSGRVQSFPEIDRADWFAPEEAMKRINPAQAALIEEAVRKVNR